MQAKSIKVEFPEELYLKVGAVALEHFKTTREYILKIISDSVREELELGDIKRQIASRYAEEKISYESLKTLLGAKEAEQIRIFKETIQESLAEADNVAQRLKK